MHPFPYDPFQKEAIAAIREGISVFLSAPTGAGKTVIAEIAVEEALKAGGMAIYTAPIKALSNQKFRDFHARYGDRVGILTGDVTLNPQAPLLIMTTEIYRNSLFEERQRFARCQWVIFDEIHYLDDPERGTVWEEALLLTPRETEILALSATIPNADQLAAWIEKIHGRPVKVIQEMHRPVPLQFAFQCQNELYRDLGILKAHGYRGQDRPAAGRRPFRMGRHRGGRHFFKKRSVGFLPSAEHHGKPNRADHLMRQIQSAGHLPCLYFTFSRRRAEELAWEFAPLNLVSQENRVQLLEQFDRLCQKYQIAHERSAAEMRELVAQGVAYHHAGLLPTLKEVVEILFATRLIGAIVTTETFALGVNMPARSVVLDTLCKRGDTAARSVLRVRELSQMAGRAGRRGMDEAGFVYLRVNPWEVPFPALTHLLQGKPEQVSSRFSLTYATLLNLYRSVEAGTAGFKAEIGSFYQKTLHAFQAPQPYQREAISLIDRKLTLLKELGYLIPQNGARHLTPKGEFAVNLYGYELILSELFENGFLERLSWIELGIFLLAMVYEPRRGGSALKISRRVREMEREVRALLEKIHREERRLRVVPMTKAPYFQLSAGIEMWLTGAAFEKVVQATGLDEGELVRTFRMTLQMARTLWNQRMASDSLRQNGKRLFFKINRDPVDAEAELRRSL